jgi:hypothetical protein
LILANTENKLFKSETYKQALQTSGLYERLPALASQQIISTLAAEASAESQDEELGFLKYLTIKDWEILILTVLPPQEMRQFTEHTLDQIFDYLDGRSDSVVISLAPFKQRLSQKSAEAAEQILATQPPCTAQQLIGIAAVLASGGDELDGKLCKPPTEMTPLVLPLMGLGVRAGITGIPDSVPLFTEARQPVDLRSRIELARLGMRSSPLVPLFFLLLLSLLAVRSRKSWLRWWGIPFTAAGALGLLVGLLNEPILRLLLIIQTANMPAYLAYSFEAALDVLLAVTREVANPLMLYSALILVAGIAMTALARYVGKEKPAPEQALENSTMAFPKS